MTGGTFFVLSGSESEIGLFGVLDPFGVTVKGDGFKVVRREVEEY